MILIPLFIALLCPRCLFAEPLIPKAVEWQRGGDAYSLVIDERGIADSGARSLAEVLAAEGFFVTEGALGAESRVTIAGLTAQNIHVYIDGVLQNTSSYGRFDWGSVDISQVARITVYRAGFCPLSCAASFSGAVVWIETKRAGAAHTSIDASSASYSGESLDTQRISALHTGRARVKPQSESGGGGADLSYKASCALTHASNGYMTDASCTLSNAEAFIAADFSNCSLSLDYRLSSSDVNTSSESGNAGEEKEVSHSVTLRSSAVISEWALEGGFNYRHPATEYDDKAYPPSQAASSDGDTHKLNTFALDAALRTPQWGCFSACFSTRQCVDRLNSTAASDHTMWNGFVKAAAAVQIFPFLAFDFGGTLDGYKDELTLNPMCAIRFSEGIFSVCAAYAFLYQRPTMEQLYWDSGAIKGNQSLTPEKGMSWTLSAKCSFSPCPFSLSVSYIDYKDKIRYMDSTFKNLSRAHIWCCEARAAPQLRLAENLFSMRLSYILTSAKIAGGAQDGAQIMDVPLHTFAAALTYRRGYLLAGITGEYASKRYVSNWNAEYNSEYFLLGAFASLDIPIGEGKSITPYLKAQNITDRSVFSDYTRTVRRPPRSFTAGARLEL